MIEAYDVVENLMHLTSNEKFINQVIKKEIRNRMRLQKSGDPENKKISSSLKKQLTNRPEESELGHQQQIIEVSEQEEDKSESESEGSNEDSCLRFFKRKDNCLYGKYS
jgi:hypothetical protein